MTLLCIVMAFLFSAPICSAANDTCDFVQSYNQLKHEKSVAKTPTDYFSVDQMIYNSITSVAKQSAKNFFDGKWSSLEHGEIRNCFEESDRLQFDAEFQQEFWEASLKFFDSQSESLKRFARATRKVEFQAFQLVGHTEPANDLEKGGFHRGTKSLFLNLSKLDSQTWHLYFAHEVLHGLDNIMAAAVDFYNDAANRNKVEEIALNCKSIESLNSSDKTLLQKWVLSAFERGLPAEARAWAATLAIYQDGIRQGVFKPVEWAQEILNGRKDNETLLKTVYRFLDPRFSNPTEDVFANPCVREVVLQLRETYPKTNLKLGRTLESIVFNSQK